MAHGSRGAVGQSTIIPPHAPGTNGVISGSNTAAATKVNNKKAKRRAKEAAKRREQEVAQVQAAEAHTHIHNGDDELDYGEDAYGDDVYADEQYYSEDEQYPAAYDPAYLPTMHPDHSGINGTKLKKKKNKGRQDQYANTVHNQYVPPPPPPPASAHVRTAHRAGRGGDRIWNTSTQEERERIKEFWLSLKEEERRSLVKVEKEAVLKKMKEQQKHSCSCTVCGRKRTAIEEELEVLYDAYYEELEQLPPDRIPPILQQTAHQPHSHLEISEDEELNDEEYSDDEDYDDEEDYSDDEPEELPRTSADFFNFGNSLTVKGGILTVADDLLKNDGKKFIEMMEQLAERRMQREEEAQYAAAAHPAPYNDYRHTHGAPEDEELDEEDEEDYDSQEEYDEDEEDTDTMTEEQRMQEGRRMFQIFAARMFEQRVLTAYREKVAAERQQKLLEELEEEKGVDAAREAKKAKDAEKKKQKKLAQKQKQAEDKAKKDADKAAQDAAAKEEAERKQEEARRKKEEARRKKEEQRKAADAEMARKQAEKLKRQKEEQERRQEAERKIREQKEAEKKAREELQKKQREERDLREREARERKLKADQERKEKETRDMVEQERSRKDTVAVQQQQAATSKRAAGPAPVPIPPGLTKQPSNFSSPHVQAAVPKAPTPVRPRQGSQQGSKGSSPKTPAAIVNQSKIDSPSIPGSASQNAPFAPKSILSRPGSQPPINASHLPSTANSMGMVLPPGMPMPQPGGFGMAAGMNGFAHGQAPIMPGSMQSMQRAPMPAGMFSPPQQVIGASFPRPTFGGPNGIPGPPPGMAGPGMPPFGRPVPEGPPGFGIQVPGAVPFGTIFADTMPARTVPGQHSRQQSGSSSAEQTTVANGPIRPPAPIQRPSSIKASDDVNDLASHLGSKALLDDDDDEPADSVFPDRRPSMPPGLQSVGSLGGFGAPPGFTNRGAAPRLDAFGAHSAGGNTWGTPSIPFGTPVLQGAPGWGGSPTGGWPTSTSNPFGLGLGGGAAPIRAGPRQHQIRLAIAQSYQAHAKSGSLSPDGFVDGKMLHSQILNTQRPAVTDLEFRNILDTEGTPQNGGGTFQIRSSGSDQSDIQVKWVHDDGQGSGRAGIISGLAPGEITSPVAGHAHPANTANTTPFGSLRGFPGLASGSPLSGLGHGL